MNDWLWELIKTIIYSIILFFLGFIFNKYILVPMKRRFNPIRTIIPFPPDSKKITICHTLIPPDTTERSYIAEEGDFLGIYMITDIFDSLYKRNRINVESDTSVEASLGTTQDIVTLSGPKWNHITERLIGEIGSPIYFERSSGSVVFKTNKRGITKYATIRKRPHLARKCHGIIISGIIKRADGTEQRVMICAGSTTISMYGIAIYLKKLHKNRKLVKILKKNGISGKNKWGLILEVKNNMPTEREGLVWLPMSPATISTGVVRYVKDKDFIDPYLYLYNKT